MLTSHSIKSQHITTISEMLTINLFLCQQNDNVKKLLTKNCDDSQQNAAIGTNADIEFRKKSA